MPHWPPEQQAKIVEKIKNHRKRSKKDGWGRHRGDFWH